jgi:hypothetical protein
VKGFAGGLLLFFTRGLLLWVVVPFAMLVGLAMKPYRRLVGRPVQIRQVIGWADLNLIAALQRSVVRPLVADPAPFVPWSALDEVVHRVRLGDPA